MLTHEEVAKLEHRLRTDTVFYAQHCLKIIDQRSKLVPLIYKPAQLRLERVMARQEAEGRPIRVMVLKARKEGISTGTEAKIVHRFTQRENHEALIVAHEKKKAGPAIFSMADTMYSHLPDETVGSLQLKPPVVASRRMQEIYLGEPSRVRRHQGHLGINSSLTVDTATEVETGRAATPTSLHLSEVAFWGEQASKKLTTLLNSVPDEPGTLVVLESTANGFNHWRRMWVRHDPATSDYEPIFFPWFEEPEYMRVFLDDTQREQFISSIGTGVYGDDEPWLVEKYNLTPEQLYWRRWAIENRCGGDLRVFKQEFPAEADEAFLSTGSQAFPGIHIKKALDAADLFDGDAEQGIIRADSYKPVKRGRHTIEIPENPIWVPADQLENRIGSLLWKVWQHPVKGDGTEPAGQYVCFLDPATGDDTESGERAFLAGEIIDHKTREQIAELQTRADPGLVAESMYLMALYFNMAHLGVEVTGGYGVEIARSWWRGWHYPHVYFRRPKDRRNQEKHSDRLGWQTDSTTKGQMVTHMAELLRIGKHGIKSAVLADELTTFMKEGNKFGPEADSFADCLMAYMGAQKIADEIPLRSDRMAKVKAGVISAVPA